MKQFGLEYIVTIVLLCILFSFFAAVGKVEAKIETLLERGVKFNRGDISIAPINNVYLRLRYDCNLVLKKGTPNNKGKTIWSSKSAQQQITTTNNDDNDDDDTNCYVKLQGDGNLVIYKYVTTTTIEENDDESITTTKAIFSTNSAVEEVVSTTTTGEKQRRKNYKLVVDSNERLIILKDHYLVNDGEYIEHWSNMPSYLLSNTILPSGNKIVNSKIDGYITLQSSDGNFVLREGTNNIQNSIRVLWDTGVDQDQDTTSSDGTTSSTRTYYLKLETNGKLNIYKHYDTNDDSLDTTTTTTTDDTVIWSSNVEGTIDGTNYFFTLNHITNRPTVYMGTPDIPGDILWEAETTKQPVFIFIDKNNGNLIWIKRSKKIILSKSRIHSYNYFNDKVVWTNSSSKVYFFNGHETIQLSNTNDIDRNPQISKRYISFERQKTIESTNETIYQIYLYNYNMNDDDSRSSNNNIKIQKVSNFNTANEHSSILVENEIVYLVTINGMNDVYHYDGSKNNQITNTPTKSEYMLRFSKDYIVWVVESEDDDYNPIQNIVIFDGINTNEIYIGAYLVWSIIIDRSTIAFNVAVDDISHGIYIWQDIDDIDTDDDCSSSSSSSTRGTIKKFGYNDYNGRPSTWWDYDIKGNYFILGDEYISSIDTIWYIRLFLGNFHNINRNNIIFFKLRQDGRRMEPKIFGNYILYYEAPGDYWDNWSTDYSVWIYNIWTNEHKVLYSFNESQQN